MSRHLVFLIFAVFVFVSGAANATELSVVSSGGFAAALKALAPRYEQATGNTLILAWGPSMGETHDAVPARLARGEHIRQAWHPLGHVHTGVFHGSDFVRVVRQQPDRLEPEVPQDLSRQQIAPQIGIEPEALIGLYGVGALVLQLVGAQLVHQTDSAAFLQFINYSAAAFGGSLTT